MLDAESDCSENQFFDALEEIDVVSDLSVDRQFDVWVNNPESVETRRNQFFSRLGLSGKNILRDDSEKSSDFGVVEQRNEGVIEQRKAVFEYEFSSSRSSMTSFVVDDPSSSGNSTPKVHFESGVEKLDRGFEGSVGNENKELFTSEIFVHDQRPERSSSSSSFSGEFSFVKNTSKKFSLKPTKKVKKWWLNRLRSFTCVTEMDEESCKYDSSREGRIQRVKVHQSGKQSKEISALYYGQSIEAHQGAILTMKFSPNGRFLASAGEDKVVRVWQVLENDRSNVRDIPDMNQSSVFFTMNNYSELKPLRSDKEKNGKWRKTPDSACVVLPPKVFCVHEKPLHEFQGHTSEILDLSWSKTNFLLSSSVDKTVRLWRVGHNHCLKVYPHNNFVTCVEFNPIDENYFISGSIDGKVRIWETSLCKVVYWTEIKDIVTAVCYRPDGRGGIIGSISGSCRFFSISDHQIQLDAQISLHTKKKSSGKRITGFQFFPRDPSKVMVSCADSQVRIVQGVDVIGKYKGARNTGTFSSAHLTSDGKHIVSASEDSSVQIWKCVDHASRESSHIKKVKSSERFVSNASVALPWPGLQNKSGGNVVNGPSFSPARFSCGQECLQESNYPKGSALWPEEKLLAPTKTSSLHKSEYKFLRTCQSRSDSHAWGMVIVTAGWDGRIRSFHNYGLPVPP